MLQSFKSTCCYCGVGCGIEVNKDPHGKLLVEGDKITLLIKECFAARA